MYILDQESKNKSIPFIFMRYQGITQELCRWYPVISSLYLKKPIEFLMVSFKFDFSFQGSGFHSHDQLHWNAETG